MPKIVFIGAGSTVFAKNLMGDLLGFPELANSTLMLMDINEERLRTSKIVAHKVARALGANPVIEATTDRREALKGADYVICMIQVAGYKPGTVVDFEIPKKYGLRQTIADTLGIGGDNTSTTFSGVISSTGGTKQLTKTGTGTLTFTGANTYNGTTTISGGTLLANNSTGSATGSGAVTVANGGTLAGNGRVSGTVTVNGLF